VLPVAPMEPLAPDVAPFGDWLVELGLEVLLGLCVVVVPWVVVELCALLPDPICEVPDEVAEEGLVLV
jgi:hypothetical protein